MNLHGLTAVVSCSSHKSSFACPWSSFPWCRIYAAITCSLTPTVETKYPALHIPAFFTYSFFKNRYFCLINRAELLFNTFTTQLTALFGGMLINRWMWSSSQFASLITISGYTRVIPCTLLFRYSPILLRNIFLRYRAHNTI